MAKVSVLIPFYNSEAYLKTCIDSILNQTYQDFELILLNDGSTDKSEEIVKSYNDKRIKYYKNEKNLGPAGSSNKLIELASGEYCVRVDSDDICFPERVEKQVHFLDENKNIALVGTWIRLYNALPARTLKDKIKKVIINLGWIWCHPTNVTLKETLKANTVMHSTMCFRKSLVIKNNIKYSGLYDYAEDYDFVRQFLTSGLEVANIPEVLLYYHFGGESTSKKHKIEQKKTDAKVKEDICKYLGITKHFKYPYWLIILRKLRLDIFNFYKSR